MTANAKTNLAPHNIRSLLSRETKLDHLGRNKDDDQSERRADSCVVRESVSTRAHDQQIVLVPNGGKKIRRSPDENGDQHRVGRNLQALRYRNSDLPHDDGGGDIIEENREQHCRRHHRGGGPEERSVGKHLRQFGSEQLSSAGGLETLAHRDHGADENDDRPVDLRINLSRMKETERRKTRGL